MPGLSVEPHTRQYYLARAAALHFRGRHRYARAAALHFHDRHRRPARLQLHDISDLERHGCFLIWWCGTALQFTVVAPTRAPPVHRTCRTLLPVAAFKKVWIFLLLSQPGEDRGG